jgi:hypothetical protein
MAENTGRFVKGWFYHGVKLTKWENMRQDGRTSVSFSIEKSYKDKATQEYKKSSTFFSDDLDALISVLLKAKSESVKEIFPKNTEGTVQSSPDTSKASGIADSFAGHVNPEYDPNNDENIPF